MQTWPLASDPAHLSRNDNGDTVLNGDDNCPSDPNAEQVDTDLDESGDACDVDDDGDLIPDDADDCPVIANSDQTNTDGDAFGDACDADDDGDGAPDEADHCPLVAEIEQLRPAVDTVGYRAKFVYCINGKRLRSGIYPPVTVLYPPQRHLPPARIEIPQR